ncbi:uncharacterized protein LOC100286470 [Salmo salar]|uniref:WW domain binding protein VOPP1 n=1 Tax=Salmo salar TaxID=8030 RepID=B9ELS1_SALSA|nr:uncharacterized protein LOC100286470 [Salmo salar]ACM08468.1 EGFR-coamplified and overexpressed protein precursor [Salmo salar]|eukprot:NP_001139881.1 vesicular, overexpressed in cancer, prosurvival protein 1 [Salmo salar]
MTKFDDKICPRRTAAPPSCSSEHSTTRCRSYENCCGTRCCVRALSIQKLWYFWTAACRTMGTQEG